MGHIYTEATCSDFEAKGMFRVTNEGATPNSGFYFRAIPPADDVNGFPRGYEAQICNHGEGYTGWLWKPGKPTGKATELLTKDGEWFSYRIRVVGPHMQFWINDKLVMTYDEAEYKTGHFAIQGHNPGMKVEAKELWLCGTIRGPKWHTFAMRPQRPMCAMLSQRAASAGRMSFSLWDHGLQGHPQGCQLSGDHAPSLLSGRSWADKQGVSRAPA